MNKLRLLAVGTTAVAALLVATPIATAAPNPDAAQAAAGYLVSHLVDGDHLTSDFGEESITADAVLALVAAGRAEDAPTIEAMTSYLEGRASSYATSAPEAAAKFALVALATGVDPAAFGGQDLIAAVQSGVQPDGSFGAFPGPYASGLAMIVLGRAGQAIPQPMVDYLLGVAATDGGWGYDPSQPADPDSTGMALLGLAAVPEPGEAVTNAISAATAWAASARAADGSWPGFAPVNSTAILGSALQAVGADQPESVAYLAALQQPGGGLPTGGEGATDADLLATAQGALLLAGADYLDLAPVRAASTGWLDPANPILWIVVALVVALVAVVAVLTVRRRRR